MLVMTRKVGERLDFYHPATGRFSVETRRVAGNRVTLACDAPGDVRIMRGELVDMAGGIHGVGTDSREGSEAPPTSAVPPAFICQAVGYPMSDRVVRSVDPKEAAEEFVRSYRRTDPTPIDVRVQRSSVFEPTATYRVELASDGSHVASLIGLRVTIDPRDDATFERIERATAQEIFESGVYEREGA